MDSGENDVIERGDAYEKVGDAELPGVDEERGRLAVWSDDEEERQSVCDVELGVDEERGGLAVWSDDDEEKRQSVCDVEFGVDEERGGLTVWSDDDEEERQSVCDVEFGVDELCHMTVGTDNSQRDT